MQLLERMFIQILQMGWMGSMVILLVLAARIPLKKAPKRFSYMLWAAVLLRLLFPFSFEGAFSLIPPNAAYVAENLGGLGDSVQGNLATVMAPSTVPAVNAVAEGITPLQGWLTAGAILWLAGMGLFALYGIVSVIRLRGRLTGTVRLRDNIYLADHISVPFVMGIVRPRIYLPSALAQNQQHPIILHEQVHIRRGDHIFKVLGFATLAIHWFNPLVWAAFFAFARDMEMSCDESVMACVKTDIRSEYSASLLSLATGARTMAASPIAFGAGDVKARIKNIMRYKKPVFWLSAVAVVAVLAIIIASAVNPHSARASLQWARSLRTQDIAAIELVVMPSNEDQRYRLFQPGEYADIVALMNQSSGRYLKNYESVDGGAITFYVTLTDGTVHTVTNSGNVYLIIDGDCFDAPSRWLSAWQYRKGGTTLPLDFEQSKKVPLTLEALKQIAAKGADHIGWEDFYPYRGTDVGSGLYIRRYEIDSQYYVLIGGASPQMPPWYVMLFDAYGPRKMDVLQEDIDEFTQLRDLIPMVMVEGQLYLDTGKQAPAEPDPSAILGQISSSVDASLKPYEDGQSNFGGIGADYARYGEDVLVRLQNEWVLFRREKSQ